MTVAHSAGVFLGTDETTGITITTTSTTTSSEIDLLGDDASTGEINFFIKFTTGTGALATVDVALFASRIASNAYPDFAPLVWSVVPTAISTTYKAWINGPAYRFPVGRRMTCSVKNNNAGSITNVTVGYELFKYS
jgi:hypothetical protein